VNGFIPPLVGPSCSTRGLVFEGPSSGPYLATVGSYRFAQWKGMGRVLIRTLNLAAYSSCSCGIKLCINHWYFIRTSHKAASTIPVISNLHRLTLNIPVVCY
jgi:hypothetical protein